MFLILINLLGKGVILMKFKLDDIAVFFIFLIVSFYLMPLYLYGDQIFYREIYKYFSDSGMNIQKNFSYYKEIVGATELFHFLFIFITSKLGLDKDLVMSFSNAFLFLFAYKACYKLSENRLISFLVVSGNYYLYVLSFSAERLKFAVIFIFLWVIYKRKIFIFLSISSHFQMFIICISRYVSLLLDSISLKISLKKTISFLFFFISFFFISFFVFKYSNLLYKIQVYYEHSQFTFLSFLKISITIMVLAFSVSKANRKEAINSLLFVSFFLLVLGADRVFMVMYLLAMFYALQYNRGYNIFVVGAILYYFYTSFLFINNLILFNDGYNL